MEAGREHRSAFEEGRFARQPFDADRRAPAVKVGRNEDADRGRGRVHDARGAIADADARQTIADRVGTAVNVHPPALDGPEGLNGGNTGVCRHSGCERNPERSRGAPYVSSSPTFQYMKSRQLSGAFLRRIVMRSADVDSGRFGMRI